MISVLILFLLAIYLSWNSFGGSANNPTLFGYMVTIDSLSTMLDYFSSQLISNRDEREREESGKEVSLQERYFYFSFLTVIAKMTDIASYGTLTPYLPYFATIMAIPPIGKYCRSFAWYRSFEERVYAWIGRQIHHLICFSFASILNLICQTSLDLNSDISSNEVSKLLDQANADSAVNFIKIFVFTNIVEAVGSTRGYIVPFLQRAFNKGKVLNQKPSCRYEDPFPHLPDPQDKIRAVITHRKFEQLCNPEIQLQLIRFYTQREVKSIIEVINDQWIPISSMSRQFTSFYTLTHLMSPIPFLYRPIILGTASLGYYFYQRTQYDRYWIFRLVGTVFYYLTGSRLIGTAINELGQLLDHEKVYSILAWLRKQSRKIKEVVSYWEIGEITMTALLSIILSSLPDRTLSTALLLISFLLSSSKSITGPIIGFGIFSNYNPIHILSLSAMILLARIGNRITEVEDKPIELPQIFESYIQEKPEEKEEKTHLGTIVLNESRPKPSLLESPTPCERRWSPLSGSNSAIEVADQLKGRIQSTASFQNDSIEIGDEVIDLSKSSFQKVYQDGICFRETYLEDSFYQMQQDPRFLSAQDYNRKRQ
jgi:hypothetical protein